METYEKVLVLNNEFEAGLMEEILTDRKIPHGIITSDDTALGGIVELEYGWGYIEAPAAYRDEITKLYAEAVKP
ncbi:MAG: hypothetical protein EOM90_02960 [Alphaproteobacteria bacterium]|nr:hypothetical protein [Alphaproteobacteria bacterium]